MERTAWVRTRTAWHKKFAEIFERIWESEYMKGYNRASASLVRYLPVQKLAPTLQRAWPSDRLEEILDRYEDFAVTHCQCRQTMDLTGRNRRFGNGGIPIAGIGSHGFYSRNQTLHFDDMLRGQENG